MLCAVRNLLRKDEGKSKVGGGGGASYSPEQRPGSPWGLFDLGLEGT